MLKMSPAAANYVSQVRDEQGLPADTPLRIAAETTGEQLEQLRLGFVAEPVEGDQVDQVEGQAYCVAPELAAATDSIVLDVEHSDGEAKFFLADERQGG